jgi:hypothetical protein
MSVYDLVGIDDLLTIMSSGDTSSDVSETNSDAETGRGFTSIMKGESLIPRDEIQYLLDLLRNAQQHPIPDPVQHHKTMCMLVSNDFIAEVEFLQANNNAGLLHFDSNIEYYPPNETVVELSIARARNAVNQAQHLNHPQHSVMDSVFQSVVHLYDIIQ